MNRIAPETEPSLQTPDLRRLASLNPNSNREVQSELAKALDDLLAQCKAMTNTDLDRLIQQYVADRRDKFNELDLFKVTVRTTLRGLTDTVGVTQFNKWFSDFLCIPYPDQKSHVDCFIASWLAKYLYERSGSQG